MKIGLKPVLSLVLLIMILVPAAAIVMTGLDASARQAVTIATEEAATIGHAQSGGIEVLFGECIYMARSVALLDEIRQTANGFYNSVSERVDRVFEGLELSSPELLDIIVTDINGVICADLHEGTGSGAGSLFGGFEHTTGLSKNTVYISDITVADVNYDNKNTFYVLSRVEGDEENTVAGYLAMVFSVDMLVDYLKACEDLSESSLFVVDRNGTALWLYGNEVTRVGEITPTGLKDVINSVVVGGRDEASKLIDTGDGLVGGYGGLYRTGNNWNWFSVYPTADIVTLPFGIMVMMVIVGIMTLIWLVFGIKLIHEVISPLRSMSGKMRQITAGDIHTRLEPQKLAEYIHITQSFNSMMDEVLISGEMHRTITELSENMLFDWDFRRNALYVSDNLLKMLDIDPSRATLMNGKFIDSLMNTVDAERFKIDMNKLLRTKDSVKAEYQVATRFGSTIWILVRINCIADRMGELVRAIGVITNINNEKLLSIQLSERASFDFLSGLYNRDTFIRQLGAEVERNVNSRVGVIFIDVDDFKFINDRYGHNTGDEIIKRVANIVKEKLGDNGFAGRFGGDEFVMCVTNETALNRIDVIARAVLNEFSQGYHYEKENITIPIKASLGIAISPQHGRDSETLLAAADEAMYFVKKNGKSNFFIYTPEGSVLSGVMGSI